MYLCVKEHFPILENEYIINIHNQICPLFCQHLKRQQLVTSHYYGLISIRLLLNQARVGLRPAHARFLKIVFVWMSVCACVCLCVCV